jgi:hypothetical protein
VGLTKGLRLVGGMRRQLDEDERNRIAEAIRQRLELANWKIEKGPPIGGHGQLAVGPGSRDGASILSLSGSRRV